MFLYVFRGPLPSFNWCVVLVGVEEVKWRQLAHHQLMSQQGPHFILHSKSKAIYKSTNLRKMLTNGIISDVAIASVHSEKIRLKKMIISMNKSQETTLFGGRQKLTSRYETEVIKVMDT